MTQFTEIMIHSFRSVAYKVMLGFMAVGNKDWPCQIPEPAGVGLLSICWTPMLVNSVLTARIHPTMSEWADYAVQAHWNRCARAISPITGRTGHLPWSHVKLVQHTWVSIWSCPSPFSHFPLTFMYFLPQGSLWRVRDSIPRRPRGGIWAGPKLEANVRCLNPSATGPHDSS